MRKLLIKILSPFLRLFAKLYYTKPRKFNYKGVQAIVLPGVFHPFFTISTKLLLEFIDKIDLDKKSFLELGCGTGIISVLAARKGARVVATDINSKAIENVHLNAERNEVRIESIFSDLFTAIPKQDFDFIVINPPYYPKNPKDDKEKAWFCGEEFEYFQQLFMTIKNYFNQDSKVYLILSEDCELEIIRQLAKKNSLEFKTVLEKRRMGEWNFIFQLNSILAE